MRPGLSAYLARLSCAGLMNGPSGSDSIDAVPRRTNLPEALSIEY